jgi:hypothetical protein
MKHAVEISINTKEEEEVRFNRITLYNDRGSLQTETAAKSKSQIRNFLIISKEDYKYI